jgi:predicted alpha/beta-fold hydrolase
MSTVPLFAPHRLVRNPHVQSVLASSRLRLIRHRRRAGGIPVVQVARPRVLDCGGGASLLAVLSDPPESSSCDSADLAILIHGWQGCADSTYLVSTGEMLHRAGFAVARLNLRDHGGTHHLNEEIFHANRIDEVVGAVGALSSAIPHGRLFVIGFSLGGNFALRVGLRAPAAGLAIDRIVAVNPAIDPRSTLAAIDRSPLYRRYFLQRWRRSLELKQRAFPERYDFADAQSLETVRQLSQHVIPRHTPFATLDEYFAGYTLRGEQLAGIDVPTTIVTAADDPIVSITGFLALPRTAALSVEIQPRGGHCGYILGPTLRSWLEARVAAILAG